MWCHTKRAKEVGDSLCQGKVKYDQPHLKTKLLVLQSSTLPETNIAPENGWLEYDCFLLGWPI